MFKKGDIVNSKPREGPAVSYEEYKAYLKQEKKRLKKELKKPKVVGPRNFAEEQVRKDFEDKATGRFHRDVFNQRVGTPSDGLWALTNTY